LKESVWNPRETVHLLGTVVSALRQCAPVYPNDCPLSCCE